MALQAHADKKKSTLESAVEHQGVMRQRALAGGTPISQAESVRREYADWVGSNVFQAWASDYGFDRVGSIGRGEDGELDYSTFKPGHGLKRAIKAYQRQEGRKPGGYGLRKTQTGEVLQVELKDGSTVTGHRLRRHSADPNGSIRVSTPEGTRVIRHTEVDRAIYLKRPDAAQSRLDKRYARKHERDQFEIAQMAEDARELGIEEYYEPVVEYYMETDADGDYIVGTDGGVHQIGESQQPRT